MQDIVKLYKAGLSIREVATKCQIKPNKVYSVLKGLNVPLRSKSEAQKQKLAKNGHPLAGTKLTSDTKDKISRGVANQWASITDNERERRRENSREKWESLSAEDRAAMQSSAMEGFRLAGKNGSRIERAVLECCAILGHVTESHIKDLLSDNTNLEVDIYLPEIKTAIEVDGPSHWTPIFGQEKLDKIKKQDIEKNGLLLKNGIRVIRLKCVSYNVTRVMRNKLPSILQKCIDNDEQFQEVEISL